MSIQLFNALAGHTATPERVSRSSVVKAFEYSWNSARTQTIENHGFTGQIVVGGIYNMDSRLRQRLITDAHYNNLHVIIQHVQSNLTNYYAHDPRASVLYSRIVEAHNLHRNSGAAF